MRIFRIGLMAFLALALMSSTALAGNLVLDPSFEAAGTTVATPWVMGVTEGWGLTYNGGGGHSGEYYVYGGCVGSGCIDGWNGSTGGFYLYQDLFTVAGESYQIGFWYAAGNGAPNELKVLFGGATVFDLIDVGDTPYQFYSASGQATGSTTRLVFLSREDPAFSSLDDVSVDGADGVPEPSSWMLALGGIPAWFGYRRLRSR